MSVVPQILPQLAPGEHLHIVGKEHPLQQRAKNIFLRAATIAVLLHLVAFLSVYVPKLFKKKIEGMDGVPVELKEFHTELPAPPSISGGPAGPVIPGAKPGGRSAAAALGIPDPVPDMQAEAPTIAAQTEIGAPISPDGIEGIGGGGGGGGSWNLDTLAFQPGDQLLDPNAVVAVEQMPELVSMPKPDYPNIAKEARIQGIVLVRALVGKDGRVHRTLIAKGEPVLGESAERAVRRALFKPALQSNHPVAVWVAVPVNFALQ
jgi:protein TonB